MAVYSKYVTYLKPLGKERRFYRLDSNRVPVTIGKGDVISNPTLNVKTLGSTRALDLYPLSLEPSTPCSDEFHAVVTLYVDEPVQEVKSRTHERSISS